jgi:arginyl-tRNA synthetase
MSNFEQKLYDAVRQAVKEVYDLDADESVLLIETPKDPKLGDYASSTAMKLARSLRQNPLAIAEALAEKLRELLPEAESVTVARPGFLNFRMKKDAFTAVINQVLAAGTTTARITPAPARRRWWSGSVPIPPGICTAATPATPPGATASAA